MGYGMSKQYDYKYEQQKRQQRKASAQWRKHRQGKHDRFQEE